MCLLTEYRLDSSDHYILRADNVYPNSYGKQHSGGDYITDDIEGFFQ